MPRPLRFRDVATGSTWTAPPTQRLRVYQHDGAPLALWLGPSTVGRRWQSMTAGDLRALLRDTHAPRVSAFAESVDGYRLTTLATPPAGMTSSDLLAEVKRLARRAPHGLVFVPDVAACYPGASPEAFRAALLALDRDGAVELRPESGLGTLSAADAVWCPRDPRGVILSYARVLR